MSRSKLVTTSTRAAEIVPVLVVEIVPVRDAPMPVVEMMPVLVVEIVPALVVEMVPVFANVVAPTAITNMGAQRIVLRLFIALLLRSCKSGVWSRLEDLPVKPFRQADSLEITDSEVVFTRVVPKRRGGR